jgi:hypothetical protein
MDDYNDLIQESVESLGTEGYCDLAADVLLEFFPNAVIYRLTNKTGERFGHVFLVVDGCALDINGFKSFEEMATNNDNLYPEPVARDAVRNFFRGHGRTPEERRIVTERFRDHINQNIHLFTKNTNE